MMSNQGRHFDFMLMLASLALAAFGLVLIYSGSLASTGSPHEALAGPVARQAGFAAVGLVLCLVVSRV
ncbi:MAG: cell division protein, partial [Actinomycetota bacterium]|nr:cell division protein [Actinomycetota bacterium]